VRRGDVGRRQRAPWDRDCEMHAAKGRRVLRFSISNQIHATPKTTAPGFIPGGPWAEWHDFIVIHSPNGTISLGPVGSDLRSIPVPLAPHVLYPGDSSPGTKGPGFRLQGTRNKVQGARCPKGRDCVPPSAYLLTSPLFTFPSKNPTTNPIPIINKLKYPIQFPNRL